MIIATRYKIELVEGTELFKIRNLNAPLCPNCGSLCSGYDNRLRRVIGDDGQVVVYQLRRLRCPVCDALHIELPDFIRTRKRYAGSVIDDVLNGRGDCCPADDRTMRRWKHENRPPETSGFFDADMIKLNYSQKNRGGQKENAEEE